MRVGSLHAGTIRPDSGLLLDFPASARRPWETVPMELLMNRSHGARSRVGSLL